MAGSDERTTAARLHSVAIRLLRLARAVDGASGLSAARLSVLSVLVYGSARSVTELAAAEQVSVPTMTRLLQGLEADGCVRRRRAAEDGRVVMVTVTAAGRRALERARLARVERIVEVLGGAQRGELLALADTISVLERELDRAQQDGTARARASARPARRRRIRE